MRKRNGSSDLVHELTLNSTIFSMALIIIFFTRCGVPQSQVIFALLSVENKLPVLLLGGVGILTQSGGQCLDICFINGSNQSSFVFV